MNISETDRGMIIYVNSALGIYCRSLSIPAWKEGTLQKHCKENIKFPDYVWSELYMIYGRMFV